MKKHIALSILILGALQGTDVNAQYRGATPDMAMAMFAPAVTSKTAQILAFLHTQHALLLKTVRQPKVVIGLASAAGVIAVSLGLWRLIASVKNAAPAVAKKSDLALDSALKTLSKVETLVDTLTTITKQIEPKKIAESLGTEEGQETLRKTLLTIGTVYKTLSEQGTQHAPQNPLFAQVLQDLAQNPSHCAVLQGLVTQTIKEVAPVLMARDTAPAQAPAATASSAQPTWMTALAMIAQNPHIADFTQKTVSSAAFNLLAGYAAADNAATAQQIQAGAPAPVPFTSKILALIQQNPALLAVVARNAVAGYRAGASLPLTIPAAATPVVQPAQTAPVTASIPQASLWSRLTTAARSASASVVAKFVSMPTV